jgi:hypothetical protein
VGNEFDVSGIVIPGESMEETVNTVCCKERDRERASPNKSFCRIPQSNIIVMSVPHRHDLEYKSCVNDEVKRLNRKLRKIMKYFRNASVIEVESGRDRFNKKKIAKEILDVLSEKSLIQL